MKKHYLAVIALVGLAACGTTAATATPSSHAPTTTASPVTTAAPTTTTVDPMAIEMQWVATTGRPTLDEINRLRKEMGDAFGAKKWTQAASYGFLVQQNFLKLVATVPAEGPNAVQIKLHNQTCADAFGAAANILLSPMTVASANAMTARLAACNGNPEEVTG